jgi:two-component system sensor histidine kinase ArlS
VENPESYPQLLSLAVHEVRTPASVVGGYLRMLQRDTGSTLSDRQRKMIEEAEKSCARLVDIVAELSDLAKLDAGLVKFARQPTDAFTLVAEVAGLVHEAKDRDVRFEARGQADGATMSGDATRLRSAFDAIFRAILREKPGQCTVVAERRIEKIDGRSTAIVIVADESSVQAAYDREPGPFDEKRGGMGLALPLARRVIAGHGGRIWAPAPIGEPQEPGSSWNNDPLARGSAIICLPITEPSR